MRDQNWNFNIVQFKAEAVAARLSGLNNATHSLSSGSNLGHLLRLIMLLVTRQPDLNSTAAVSSRVACLYTAFEILFKARVVIDLKLGGFHSPAPLKMENS